MERVIASETKELIGKSVLMRGWAQTVRRHAKVVFVDLRDRSGLTQLVFTDKQLESIGNLSEESVITVTGQIVERPKSLINPNIVSGNVELKVETVEIDSAAKPLPIPLNDRDVSEESRLKYRYLDIRSKKMAENLRYRHKMNQFLRDYFTKHDFCEIETPYLSKSTPEGARDYLVPSRIKSGSFYALPQSPQQYKQLLMVAGIERYFQIVRCFRDEDSRADRQPEFSQLDVELSFTSQDEVLTLIEDAYKQLVSEIFPEKSLTFSTFPRITYAEAMEKYGSDRPDMRKDKDNDDELAFVFVVEFPMFEKKDDGSWGAVHHPFTAPASDWESKFEKHPDKAIAQQYDLVLNGSEVAGGSIRIHNREILERVFRFLGHSQEDITAKFGHLLEAFQYGAPPHGGFASGLDRLYSVLLREPSIRDVIAFAKAGDGRDLMMDSPSLVDNQQLKDLGIKLDKDLKK